MKCPSCVIGLFQGMSDKNTLTFNPGWGAAGQTLDSFTDVREIQWRLKADGVELASEAGETTYRPASCMVIDPDGNPMPIDRHV
ncbi:MAG: hypothetical protein ACTSX7_00315 [Alphaproteobacteria bacterium]